MIAIGSLFAGIGGLDLALEHAIPGSRVAWQVEIEDYPRAVLARHWPDADRSVTDVRCAHTTYAVPSGAIVTAGALQRVDVLCGGFPCQDLSLAGRGAGLDGARSGLWWEYWRLVRELRPRVVVVENVAALVVRGLDAVLGSLAALGYDAEWQVLSAKAVGAPHRRERLWVVAHAGGDWQPQPGRGLADQPGRAGDGGGAVADTDRERRHEGQRRGEHPAGRAIADDGREAVAHAHDPGLEGRLQRLGGSGERAVGAGGGADAGDGGAEPGLRGVADGLPSGLDPDPWSGGEWPGVPRVAHGVPDRARRLRALGNGVVPQCAAAWAGRRAAELLGAA